MTVNIYEALAVRQHLIAAAREQGQTGISRALNSARMVVWTHELWELARSGYSAFEGCRITGRPNEPSEFWYLDSFHVPCADNDPLHETYQGTGLLVISEPARTQMIAVFTPTDLSAALDRSAVKFRRSRDCVVGESADNDSAHYLALREFKYLKIAAIEPVTVPRPERRRMARAQQDIPDIRVVQLREREPSTCTASEREYHHRWIRSGSWHRLPEPLKRDSKISGGKQGDEVVWHRPAVCGPNGAPLLQPRESLYVVAR